jgi:hypothetical protein
LEFYHNAFTNTPDPAYRMGMIRAGTGMYFHNTSDGGHYGVNGWTLDNPRTTENSIAGQLPTFGFCTGSSPIDGNTLGIGYPCRDQIGRGQDSFLWAADFGSPYPTQLAAPVYIWDNEDTSTGLELEYEIQCPEGTMAQCDRQLLQIVESRDYYTYRTSFNGTVGIGQGVIANRPATCTTGVGYWATNEGEWNANQPGNDGRLYICTATNTWSLRYGAKTDGLPYAYPHPRQSN